MRLLSIPIPPGYDYPQSVIDQQLPPGALILNKNVTLELIALLKRGIDEPAQLARALGNGITAAEVREAIADLEARNIRPTLTPGQKRRAKIHKEMAEAVRGGMPVSQVAMKFGKTPATVRIACSAHGVEVVSAAGGKGRGGNRETPTTLPIIARLIVDIADEIAGNPSEGPKEPGKIGRPRSDETRIAEELGVTSTHVYTVKRKAEAAGIFAAVEKVRLAARRAAK